MKESYLNEVILQGMVLGKIENKEKKFCILTIATNKYEDRKGNIKQNYPRVTFTGELAEKAMAYQKFDHVKIMSKIEVYEYRFKSPKEDGPKKENRQRLKGMSIKDCEKLKNINSSLVDKYDRPRNEVVIAGKVISIVSPKDNVCLLTVQTTEKYNAYNVARVTYYTDAKAFLGVVNKNDYVYAVGSVVTTEPVKENKDKKLETVMAKEIIKTNIN